MNLQDTIVAPATGNVVSAIGVIRMSGQRALDIANEVFVPFNKRKMMFNNSQAMFKDIAKANTLYFGTIYKEEKIVDEVVVSVFKAPHSFTGEDTIEISHHGSLFIRQEILQLLIDKGARMADKGEFSMRAFLNGKMNLSQAEAVADLIQSGNVSSHDLAINQLRGGYNEELKALREKFLKIASLLELEIDFSEEHEVFVDRKDLISQLDIARQRLEMLVSTFSQGNAFRKGVPVAIAGKPNSGKSTLMNAILKDNRSIVSAIEGTTRDTVEETINVNDITVRFIDTAGIRQSDNEIEQEGIKRSFQAIQRAEVVLYLVDSSLDDMASIDYQLKFLQQEIDCDSETTNNEIESINLKDKKVILVINKEDISNLSVKDKDTLKNKGAVFISAKNSQGIEDIFDAITKDFVASDVNSKVFVSNIRHYNALNNALKEVIEARRAALDGISSDLISENIRGAMHHIGTITGEITDTDILNNIFDKFCIGK